MKKIFIALTLLFAVLLVSCQNKEQKTEDNVPTEVGKEQYVADLEWLEALCQDLVQGIEENKAETDLQKSFTEIKELHQKLTTTANSLKMDIKGAEELAKVEPLLFPEYKLEQKETIVNTLNSVVETLNQLHKAAK